MAELEIRGKTVSGRVISFDKIVAFQFQSDRFTPADGFTCTVLSDMASQTFVRILLIYAGKEIFEGIVDTQTYSFGKNGETLSFSCRSLPAMSLDNEACPGTYLNLTADQVIQSHALPYGISGDNLPYRGIAGEFLVPKGTSHWEAIQLYCQKVYGKTPFINSENKVALTPFSSRQHFFSNRDPNGISYSEGSIIKDRYQMISKLMVRSMLGNYTKIVVNNLAKGQDVLRERYYNPGQEWQGKELLAGEMAVKEKQLDYFEIQLEIPGISVFYVGDLARLSDSKGDYSSLYIGQVKWEMDETGLQTRVTLWDKNVV